MLEPILFASQISFLLKIAAALAASFYIVFAFVIVKQVNKMTETLEVGLEGLIRALAIIHLLFSIGALIAVLAIL
jgi:hypothetical protein